MPSVRQRLPATTAKLLLTCHVEQQCLLQREGVSQEDVDVDHQAVVQRHGALELLQHAGGSTATWLWRYSDMGQYSDTIRAVHRHGQGSTATWSGQYNDMVR